MPFSRWGAVKVNGDNVPTGTQLSAWCNGVQYAVTTKIDLYNGKSWYSNLDISGDLPDTPDVKGRLLRQRDRELHDRQPAGKRDGVMDFRQFESARPDRRVVCSDIHAYSHAGRHRDSHIYGNCYRNVHTAAHGDAYTKSRTPTPTPTRVQMPTRTPRVKATPVRSAIDGYAWVDRDHNGYPNDA